MFNGINRWLLFVLEMLLKLTDYCSFVQGKEQLTTAAWNTLPKSTGFCNLSGSITNYYCLFWNIPQANKLLLVYSGQRTTHYCRLENLTKSTGLCNLFKGGNKLTIAVLKNFLYSCKDNSSLITYTTSLLLTTLEFKGHELKFLIFLFKYSILRHSMCTLWQL